LFSLRGSVVVAHVISSAADTEQKSAEDMAEIAQKLNNPVASLISVPLQINFDFGGGQSPKALGTAIRKSSQYHSA
jgi:hypothetical protein